MTDVTISISVEQEDFSSPVYGLYEIYSATQVMMIPVSKTVICKTNHRLSH